MFKDLLNVRESAETRDRWQVSLEIDMVEYEISERRENKDFLGASALKPELDRLFDELETFDAPKKSVDAAVERALKMED